MPGAISCVEWIPKGVADPNPKRYELSQREQELIDSYQEIEKEGGTIPIPSQYATLNDADGMDVMGVIQEEMDGNDDDDAAVADGDGDDKEVTAKTTEKSASEKIAEQQIDPSSLPAELKMDDYSDDEGNGPVIPSSNIDELVIESHLAENNSDNDEDDNNDDDDEQMEDDNEGMENSDDSDEDEIEPGMGGGREYMPTDIKGMEAMKFVDLDEEEIEQIMTTGFAMIDVDRDDKLSFAEWQKFFHEVFKIMAEESPRGFCTRIWFMLSNTDKNDELSLLELSTISKYHRNRVYLSGWPKVCGKFRTFIF